MATMKNILGTKTTDVLSSNGFVNGYYLDPVLENSNSYYLTWNYTNLSNAIWNSSFKDGVFQGTTNNERYLTGGLSESGFYDFKTYKSSQYDVSGLSTSPLAVIPEKGNALKLSWSGISIADVPDFYSYVLYQGSGSGYTIIAELIGNNTTSYSVTGLTDGTEYTFKLEYKDYLGNISDNNNVYSGTVQTNPLPTTYQSGFPWVSGSGSGATSGTAYSGYPGQLLTYNSGTRKVTVSGIAPSGQHADLAYYAVFNNYNPEYGLMSSLNDEPVIKLYSGMTYTSYELYSGSWIWSMAAVDNAGFISDMTISKINISASGTELPAMPTAPYSVYCEPLAGGLLYTNVSFGEIPSNVTNIIVSISGQTYSHDFVSGYHIYEYNFSGLTDNTEYSVSAYSTNSGSNSIVIYGNSCIVDSSAPSGNSVLTIEKVTI